MTDSAYIGLGANIGRPERTLALAVEMLGGVRGIEVKAVSPAYRTAPVGPVEQPEFVNMAAHLETTLLPLQLLGVLLDVEQRLGRVRTVRWGPRSIDLDLLLYGDVILDQEGLKVPHSHMHKRGFVLAPLAQIAPDAYHPVLQKTVGQLHLAWLQSQPDHESLVRRVAGPARTRKAGGAG